MVDVGGKWIKQKYDSSILQIITNSNKIIKKNDDKNELNTRNGLI